MSAADLLSQALSSLTPAIFGLLGIVLGAFLTSWNQKQERRHRFILGQIEEFYAPMLAIRERLRAKLETSLKINSAASAAWEREIGEAGDRLEEVRQELRPEYDNIIEYNNQQLRDELIPLYVQMIDLFTAKMHLAEASTRTHFPALVEFVELWQRTFRRALPRRVAEQISANEKRLLPLYDDLEKNFERLQSVLKQ